MKGKEERQSEAGSRPAATGSAGGLPTAEHYRGQLPQALLRQGHTLAAFGAADRAAGEEMSNGHNFTRRALAQGVPRPAFGHAVQHFGGRGIGASRERTRAPGAVKFDLHGSSPERGERIAFPPDIVASGIPNHFLS